MKNYGKNPTLLKVEYQKPNKKKDLEEKFKIVYLDDNGTPQYAEEEALADIWIVKPEYRTYSHNKPQERIDYMDKVSVPISKIKDRIVKESGDWGKAIREKAKVLEDWSYEDQLFKWPYVYGADFLPEFYFIHRWFNKYPLQKPSLTKCFMDIETDIMDYQTDLDDLQDTAFAPVNLVTVIHEEYNEAYQFILRPYVPPKNGLSDEEYAERYKMYEKQLEAHNYMMSHLDEHIKNLHERFDSTYEYIEYHIREYENEIDLIADVFRYINTRKPSFCLIWNMRFDIQYLYWRIIALHYDPDSIMCSPEIPNGHCHFKLDKSTFLIEKQFDFFQCDSFTQYLCQMRLYASIRKSQHKLRSVALNAIGDRELKDKKVEYPDNANIKTFPYDDWILFCIYNLKDVLLQKGIERKTNDLLTYYMRAMKNQTPFAKIFRETHLLRNVREMYFEKEGWVQGNNLNTIGEHHEEESDGFYGSEEDDSDTETDPKGKSSFKGAINAEPTMNDTVGEYVLEVQTNNLFANSIDYDMGAFYPSIKIISNLDAMTLLYKASFNNEEFVSGQYPNRSLNQQYEERDKNGNLRQLDITGEAVNTYVSGNMLTFGYNFMGLPSISELEEIVMKELGT